MKIKIDENARYIIDKLYDAGFEAYVVGGCVRDSLLGKSPKDWDITTSASPNQVKKIFNRTIDTGIKHGTITVMLKKCGYEVTTYRIDGEYDDSRHPKEVTFTSNLAEDLKRRDFTINAMAYNDKDGLIDLFDGEKDLKNKIIRCVGDPLERFSEDALRMLRAVRFSARLDFDIDSETKMAISKLAHNITNISAERIKAELDKTLLSNSPEKIYTAYELGLTKHILKEFDDIVPVTQETIHHMYTVGIHTLKALEYARKCEYTNELDEKEILIIMWAVLLHDIGKKKAKTIDKENVAHFKKHDYYSSQMAKEIFLRLKFDNYTMERALGLIAFHDYRYKNTKAGLRRAANKIGRDLIELLFIVQRSDIMGQSIATRKEKIDRLDESIKIYKSIEFDCITIKDLAINGKDLINVGINPGKHMGQILKFLLEEVLEDPNKNSKEYLIERALEKADALNCNKTNKG